LARRAVGRRRKCHTGKWEKAIADDQGPVPAPTRADTKGGWQGRISEEGGVTHVATSTPEKRGRKGCDSRERGESVGVAANARPRTQKGCSRCAKNVGPQGVKKGTPNKGRPFGDSNHIRSRETLQERAHRMLTVGMKKRLNCGLRRRLEYNRGHNGEAKGAETVSRGLP